jgi:hypothetical protein
MGAGGRTAGRERLGFAVVADVPLAGRGPGMRAMVRPPGGAGRR